MMTSIYLKLAAWVGSVLAVLGLLYGCYHYGKHVQFLEDSKVADSLVITQQKINQANVMEYVAKLSTSETQHDQDQNTIDNLHAQLSDAGRVHVHFPTCPESGPSQASTNSNGAAGILSERVDAAFASLQTGVDELTKRCDQLNIDAIRLNSQVK